MLMMVQVMLMMLVVVMMMVVVVVVMVVVVVVEQRQALLVQRAGQRQDPGARHRGDFGYRRAATPEPAQRREIQRGCACFGIYTRSHTLCLFSVFCTLFYIYLLIIYYSCTIVQFLFYIYTMCNQESPTGVRVYVYTYISHQVDAVWLL